MFNPDLVEVQVVVEFFAFSDDTPTREEVLEGLGLDDVGEGVPKVEIKVSPRVGAKRYFTKDTAPVGHKRHATVG
jgi:hypothetical protein